MAIGASTAAAWLGTVLMTPVTRPDAHLDQQLRHDAPILNPWRARGSLPEDLPVLLARHPRKELGNQHEYPAWKGRLELLGKSRTQHLQAQRRNAPDRFRGDA